MSDTRDSVENAISTALSDNGEMVTRWVACIESISQDGARGVFLLTNQDAQKQDTLGLLTYGLQFEQAALAARLMNEE